MNSLALTHFIFAACIPVLLYIGYKSILHAQLKYDWIKEVLWLMWMTFALFIVLAFIAMHHLVTLGIKTF